MSTAVFPRRGAAWRGVARRGWWPGGGAGASGPGAWRGAGCRAGIGRPAAARAGAGERGARGRTPRAPPVGIRPGDEAAALRAGLTVVRGRAARGWTGVRGADGGAGAGDGGGKASAERQRLPAANLQTLYPRNLDPRLVRLQLGRALDVWAQNSKLTFSEVDSKRADILVYFERGYHGDGYPFDGRGQILAHAFFPGDGRGGDAHFDEEENWLLNEVSDESEGTSLFAVAAHEFGHSLGLSHSSMPGALMYPWYQGITPNFQLPDDDRHGIQQLYGSKEDRKKWGPFITSKPHRPPPTTSTTTTTTTTTRKPYVRPTKRRDPPRYTPPPPRYPVHYPTEEEDDKPNGCEMSYDAISVIRGEVFIFKGRYLWRIGNDGLLPNYPAEIRRLWHRLPENLTHVDAVYERNDKKIVFFIGKMYYTFDANTLESRRPLTHLGLPESLQKIDGAMVWGHNKKTYFFSGTMYWRFDEDVGKVELDYPRDMSMWKGVDYNIDTVFQWKDGKTYFFKGKGYWKFNDYRMSVENERQLPSGPKWLGCPLSERSNEHKHYSLGNRGEPEDTNFNTSSSACTRSLHTVAGVILITHIIGFIRILIKFL
ncbi:hypothetical protein R5R35_008070 [Gryllus longicercus]|uniref:Peptidase metallopeptidase domain-containing protein n=1 Tax=Gryllus longicercus TaxID=2509291 RepID=A0AAN9V7B8_9ORTH